MDYSTVSDVFRRYERSEERLADASRRRRAVLLELQEEMARAAEEHERCEEEVRALLLRIKGDKGLVVYGRVWTVGPAGDPQSREVLDAWSVKDDDLEPEPEPVAGDAFPAPATGEAAEFGPGAGLEDFGAGAGLGARGVPDLRPIDAETA